MSLKKTILLNKICAFFLCLSLASAHSPAYAVEIPRANAHLPARREIIIPEELGTAEESREASTGKTVIYIQDAHDSFEAQQNISKIIHYLVQKYGVKTVFEEGYEGPVPTDQYFAAIPNKKIREKVAYFLMDKLRLGGAEYAHITRSKDFQLIGADSFKLHRKNIERYQQSARYQKDTEKNLNAMDAVIRELFQRYFTKDLKEWMEARERFQRGEMELLDYLKRTQTLFLKGVELEKFQAGYPNISLLLAAAKTQDKQLLIKFKASVNYKNLFREINQLEDDYAQTHLSEARDRSIFQYYKLIQLLKRLNAIEVTEEEYEAVKEKLAGFNTVSIAEFIVKQTHKSIVLSKNWEKHIRSAIGFYEVARQRDGSIQKQLEAYRSSDEKSPIVLVYGGFHKGSIKELLNQSELSYSVVMPKITHLSPKHQAYYKQLMRMGYDSLAMPVFVPKANTPPRVFDFGVERAERQRVMLLMRRLEDAAVNSPGDLVSAIGTMDLRLAQSEKTVRSESRSTEEDPAEAVKTLKEEYVRRLAELKSAARDQDAQSHKINYESLIHEIADRIYALALKFYPETKDQLAMVVLESRGLWAPPRGQFFVRPGQENSMAASWLRQASETIFGKIYGEVLWEITRTDHYARIPAVTVSGISQSDIAQAEEFANAHFSGGAREIFEERLQHYRSQMKTAQEVYALKQRYEATSIELWDASGVRAVEDNMKRQSGLADETIREIYSLAKNLYPEQVQQLALMVYGSQGRNEMQKTSDSEGRIILNKEGDAPDATAFISDATEAILPKTRWLVLLAEESISMGSDASASLRERELGLMMATELLDARFLAGNPSIADARLTAYQHQLRDHRVQFVKSMIDVWNAYYQKVHFTKGLYQREPDIKEGIGGLRTMHHVRWIAQAYTQKSENYFEELISRGLLTRRELTRAKKAYRFMNQLRAGLAKTKTGRGNPELMTVDVQKNLARDMGYEDSLIGGTAVDQMLRDFYAKAFILFQFSYQVIRRISESRDIRPVSEITNAEDEELFLPDHRKLEARLVKRVGSIFRLSLGFHEVSQDSPETFLVPLLEAHHGLSHELRPESIMPIFRYLAESKQEDLLLSGDLLDAIRNSVLKFKETFNRDEDFREKSIDDFNAILKSKHAVGYVLTRMHYLGIFSAFLPGFDQIQFRTRLGLDDRTTLDHSVIQSIAALDQFVFSGVPNVAGQKVPEAVPAFFAQIGSSKELLSRLRLALLLDAFNDAEFKKVTEQLHIDSKTAEQADWFRHHHNDLVELIRRGSFWSGEVLPDYVETQIHHDASRWLLFIGASLARLHELRPEQFWLYLKAVEPAFMAQPWIGSSEKTAFAEWLREQNNELHGRKTGQDFWRNFPQDRNTAVEVEALDKSSGQTIPGAVKVTVYHRQTEDKPGRLEKIAGVFAANGLEIQMETVGTAVGGGNIVDSFIAIDRMQQSRATPRGGNPLSGLEMNLGMDLISALEREIPISQIFKNKGGFAPSYISQRPSSLIYIPTEIFFDEEIQKLNLSEPPAAEVHATRMRLETADRPFLLYTITKIIAAHGINIETGSTIDTEGYDARIGKKAVDTFLLSYKGQELSPERKTALRIDLQMWLGYNKISLAQLDRHKDLRIFKSQIEDYLIRMQQNTAPRIAYVGDIHGDFTQLKRILTRLETQSVNQIVFMGDFMDRGPEGVAVVDALRALAEKGQAVLLAGNHEMMFIDSVLGDDMDIFRLWLRSGGWSVVREIFGDRLPNGLDISETGIQNIKNDEWQEVASAVRGNERLQETAQWLKANLKIFYEDENLGLSVHARLNPDAKGNLKLDSEDQNGRTPREVLESLRSDWNRGDKDNKVKRLLLDSSRPEASLTLGVGDWPEESSWEGSPLQTFLSQIHALRIFYGHVEVKSSPQEHLKTSQKFSGRINPIDFALGRPGFGGFAVSDAAGLRKYILPGQDAETNMQTESPAEEMPASGLIAQAKETLAFVTREIEDNRKLSGRSEARSSEDTKLQKSISFRETLERWIRRLADPSKYAFGSAAQRLAEYVSKIMGFEKDPAGFRPPLYVEGFDTPENLRRAWRPWLGEFADYDLEIDSESTQDYLRVRIKPRPGEVEDEDDPKSFFLSLAITRGKVNRGGEIDNIQLSRTAPEMNTEQALVGLLGWLKIRGFKMAVLEEASINFQVGSGAVPRIIKKYFSRKNPPLSWRRNGRVHYDLTDLPEAPLFVGPTAIPSEADLKRADPRGRPVNISDVAAVSPALPEEVKWGKREDVSGYEVGVTNQNGKFKIVIDQKDGAPKLLLYRVTERPSQGEKGYETFSIEGENIELRLNKANLSTGEILPESTKVFSLSERAPGVKGYQSLPGLYSRFSSQLDDFSEVLRQSAEAAGKNSSRTNIPETVLEKLRRTAEIFQQKLEEGHAWSLTEAPPLTLEAIRGIRSEQGESIIVRNSDERGPYEIEVAGLNSEVVRETAWKIMDQYRWKDIFEGRVDSYVIQSGPDAGQTRYSMRLARSESRNDMISIYSLKDEFGILADEARYRYDKQKKRIFSGDVEAAVLLEGAQTIFRIPGKPGHILKISLSASENGKIFHEAEILYQLQKEGAIPGIPYLVRVGMLENGGMWVELKGIPRAFDLSVRMFGSLGEFFEKMIAAAQIVKAVHDKGKLHADIKPDNFLTNNPEDGGNVQLNDFDGAVEAGSKREPGFAPTIYASELERGENGREVLLNKDTDAYNFILVLTEFMDFQRIHLTPDPKAQQLLKQMRDHYLGRIFSRWEDIPVKEMLERRRWRHPDVPFPFEELPRKQWKADMSSIIEQLREDQKKFSGRSEARLETHLAKSSQAAEKIKLPEIPVPAMPAAFQIKVGIVTDMSGGINLQQLEQDYEIPARLSKEMRLVFYHMSDVHDPELRRRIELMQQELGEDRIAVFDRLPEASSLSRLPVDIVHIIKGQPRSEETQVIAGLFPKAKRLLHARYLGEETGVVPVMLLYLQSPWQNLKKNVILDLSMVNQGILEKVQDYFSSLLIERAA